MEYTMIKMINDNGRQQLIDGNKRVMSFSEFPIEIPVMDIFNSKTIKVLPLGGKTSKRRKLEKMFGLSKKRRIKNSWKNS